MGWHPEDRDDRTKLDIGKLMSRGSGGPNAQTKHIVVKEGDAWRTLCTGGLALRSHAGYLVNVGCSVCRTKRREARGR